MSNDPGGGSRAFGSFYELLSGDTTENAGNLKRKIGNRRSPTEFTKSMKIDCRNGPRFLVLHRLDKEKTMETENPFFIKKAMDAITSNVQISRTRNGDLLLKTVDRQQASKLVKQSTFGGINVKITEHETLNLTSGTIYCPDLISLSDAEILEELRKENVTKVSRMQRKEGKKNKDGKDKLIDTGTFVLTFDLCQLPDSINVGFYSCKVKLYVPSPMRCANCLRFGHTKNHCKGNRICANCGGLFHLDGKCTQPSKCLNCGGDHPAISRTCAKFVDELEIQRIRVTDRVSVREARRKRRQQVPEVPIFTRSYAQVAQNATRNENSSPPQPSITEKTTHQPTKTPKVIQQQTNPPNSFQQESTEAVKLNRDTTMDEQPTSEQHLQKKTEFTSSESLTQLHKGNNHPFSQEVDMSARLGSSLHPFSSP
ncbi:uncharacterized protein LOC129753135 [Uranotaenia lowii]|uniref:uncharacterized protein LOC129753135 n=1 Tax=Uranotaenia lowii TaxID=190385 RepID=UPI0024796EA8|nr:uncharacterized protein LOC129753135 [Uranotaenia lowii]